MSWRSINDPFCGHSCFWWCHGTLREGMATPQVMSWWILTYRGPPGVGEVVEEVLKKSLDPHLVFWWPCNPCWGHGALVWWWWPCMVLNMLWNPWTCPWYDEESHEYLEPLMKTLTPSQRSWTPLLAWWHDEGTHTHVMTLVHLLACYGLMWCWKCGGHTCLHLIMGWRWCVMDLTLNGLQTLRHDKHDDLEWWHVYGIPSGLNGTPLMRKPLW